MVTNRPSGTAGTRAEADQQRNHDESTADEKEKEEPRMTKSQDCSRRAGGALTG